MKRKLAALAVLSLAALAASVVAVSAHTPKLAAPTDLHAVVSGDAVDLTWQPVERATGYAVTGDHDVSYGATSTPALDLTLPCSRAYGCWATLHVQATAAGWRTSARAWVTVVTHGGAPGPSTTPTPRPSSTPSPTTTPTPTPTATPSGTPTASGSCSPGSFPTSFFAPDFVGPLSRTFNEQFIRNEGSYIQTCYPAGSSAPSSGQPGGAQAKLAIAAGPRLSYTLTYQIRFPVGFQWVKGGKLPGLCGGKCWTGSNNGPGGWSTRFMWRAGGVAEVLLSDATTTGYGTDLFRSSGDWSWQADGQWHTISQTVTLNTPGVADGTITVSYDGRQVAQATGITFRAAGDTDEIDSLMFTTFFGGHGPSWAPSSTQEIDFAGFTVS